MSTAGQFAPFRRPLFTTLWFAYLLSAIGTQVQVVGAAWLMTSMTREASEVALITTANATPMLLFAMIAGALCDIFDRRVVLVVAQVIMLVGASVLAACTYAGLITPTLLVACTFVIGTGFALNAPAWQAITRDLVDMKLVPAAIAANSVAFNAGRMVGPAVGGIVVAAAGAAMAFLTNSLSYLFLIAVLVFWRRKVEPLSQNREELIPAVMTGFRYALHTPAVRAILWRDVAFGAANAAVLALMPLIARERPDATPLDYGLLLASIGAGSICGGLLMMPMRTRFGASRVVQISFLIAAIATIVIAFVRFAPWLHMGMFGIGLSTVMALSTLNAAIQLSVPNWVMGRVIALHQTALFGGLAAGSVLWGAVATAYGLTTAIGAGALLVTTLVYLSRRFTVALDAPEGLKRAEPFQYDPRIPEDQRDQPVVVTIEYHVPEESVAAFQKLMDERRQMRRRNGAFGWMLLRSLDDTGVWIEQWHTRDWADHQRYRSRRTVNEVELQKRIVAIHAAEKPPKLRYYLDTARTLAMPQQQAENIERP